MTAQDPAYMALWVWLDLNLDGATNTDELTSLSAQGITAIDFSVNPPVIVRSTGSTQTTQILAQTLTKLALVGDVLGEAGGWSQGSYVQVLENPDGTGTTTMYANALGLDQLPADTQLTVHGGDAATGVATQATTIHVGNPNLYSTTHNTIQSTIQNTLHNNPNSLGNQTNQSTTTITAGDTRVQSNAIPPASLSAAAIGNPEVMQSPLLKLYNASNDCVFIKTA